MAERTNMKDRTQEAILNAFNTLIEKNDFDKITIQMIIDEAGVGRTTFYRYFKDKYDVMNYNYMRYLQEYLMSGKVQTFEDFFQIMTSEGTEFFRHIQKIFDSNGANSFQNYLYEASFYAVQMVFAMRGHPQLTPAEYLQYSRVPWPHLRGSRKGDLRHPPGTHPWQPLGILSKTKRTTVLWSSFFDLVETVWSSCGHARYGWSHSSFSADSWRETKAERKASSSAAVRFFESRSAHAFITVSDRL